MALNRSNKFSGGVERPSMRPTSGHFGAAQEDKLIPSSIRHHSHASDCLRAIASKERRSTSNHDRASRKGSRISGHLEGDSNDETRVYSNAGAPLHRFNQRFRGSNLAVGHRRRASLVSAPLCSTSCLAARRAARAPAARLERALLLLTCVSLGASILLHQPAQARLFSSGLAREAGSADTPPASGSSLLSALQDGKPSAAGADSGAPSSMLNTIHDVVSAVIASQAGSAAAAPSAGAASGAAPTAAPAASSLAAASAAGSGSGPGSGSGSGSGSIVASISSAVASAAASAAVSAAQSALSGGDARSIVNGAGSAAAQPARSQALHLAMKLADAIPEVPYNILHNMKKLDHAAPFYNIGSRTNNPGSPKESGGLLAAGSAGRFEQLSSLLKSPLWKRIADGYGEFASEFRSLFKLPANTMKGPTSSTSKLLRDISVPALLMLLAAAMPGEWRPARTRRKSMLPVSDLAQIVEPLTIASASSASEPVSSISAIPMFSTASQAYGLLQAPALQQYPQIQARDFRPLNGPAAAYGADKQTLDQLANPVSRIGDVGVHQQAPAAAFGAANIGNWPQPLPASSQVPSQAQQQQQQQQQLMMTVNSGQNANIGEPTKRVGDLVLPFGRASPLVQVSAEDSQGSMKKFPEDPKPANNGPSYQLASRLQPMLKQYLSPAQALLSSLTSNLADQMAKSRLMKIMSNAQSVNENAQGLGSYELLNFAEPAKNAADKRRDQLNDGQRYALLEPETSEVQQTGQQAWPKSATYEQTTPQKPTLIKAMSRAISTLLDNSSPLESGLAALPVLQAASRQLAASAKDKSIHQKESVSRRDQAQGALSVEQRDLSQILPQTWKDMFKRTVNNVQQQATTQWRSVENQVANWMQDKLKTPQVASNASGSSGQAAAATPVANIIQSVGSTAINMLGFGSNKSSNGSSSSANRTESEPGSTNSAADSSSPSSKSKKDSANRAKQSSTKSALSEMASLIVNTLTNRQSTSTSSNTSSKAKETSSSSANLASNTGAKDPSTLSSSNTST